MQGSHRAPSGVKMQPEQGQDEVIALLSDPRAYSPAPPRVERIDTHGAIIFLAGDRAYKIKRAVRLPYLDFSTLARRRAACEREIEINRLTAPDMYLGTIAIVRNSNGALQLGGEGDPVEWVVEMMRFDQSDLLDVMAREGRLSSDLMIPLTDHIAGYHKRAPVIRNAGGAETISRVVAQAALAFSKSKDRLDADDVQDFTRASREMAHSLAGLLDRRAAGGYVRRCHGDLHLGNIVLLEGKPTLFDAIEFDERLASIDILYDLAFLLMDLWMRGYKRHANIVLNRYLAGERGERGEDGNIAGLAALPLFLSCRAGVRAMVMLDRLPHIADAEAEKALADLKAYFDSARRFLEPPRPRLIAAGGLSGTGKSTLAGALAPYIGAAPGALWLRSDVERKKMFDVGIEERLSEAAYTPEVTRRIYEILNEKARTALEAGRSVILDAVFSTERERRAASRVARETQVPFTGLWLSAPAEQMIARVRSRTGDASDADAAVVRRQLEYDTGEIDWHIIDAGSSPGAVLAAAAEITGVEPDGL